MDPHIPNIKAIEVALKQTFEKQPLTKIGKHFISFEFTQNNFLRVKL